LSLFSATFYCNPIQLGGCNYLPPFPPYNSGIVVGIYDNRCY